MNTNHPAPADTRQQLRDAIENTLAANDLKHHPGARRRIADALLAGPLADLATLPDRVRALADEWDTEHADWCCQRGCPNWQGTHPGEVEFTTDGGIRQIGPDFPCPGDCTCYVGPFRDRLRALTPDPRQEQQQ